MTAAEDEWARRMLRNYAASPDPSRRRNRLRRQFAKHWDAIWFHRARGMCGRTLRAIYGDGALIWSVGGGIDPEV